MTGRLWIVNYLEPFALDQKVGRILSETRPPGANKLVTSLVEASDTQVNRLRHQEEVVGVRPVSAPLESTRCVAVNNDGVRCGKPASVPDALWGGLVCEEHAAMGERMRHRQAAQRLMDTIGGLQEQLDEILEGAKQAHTQSERVSLLAGELLLGVHAHLTSGREALQIATTSLQDAMKEPE
jgi:hypothetical protein